MLEVQEKVVRKWVRDWAVGEDEVKIMSLKEFQVAQSLCEAVGVKRPQPPRACESRFPYAFLY